MKDIALKIIDDLKMKNIMKTLSNQCKAVLREE